MNLENDTFALVQRMRAMVYSSKDFESLWILYQVEGLPKNISIEEFCTKHGVGYEVIPQQGETRILDAFIDNMDRTLASKASRFLHISE